MDETVVAAKEPYAGCLGESQCLALSACASEIASNLESPHDLTARLPVELLTAYLYAADMATRIQASHVARAWRAMALAERGLWTYYFCKPFPWRGQGLQDSLDFLEAILCRSDPLPFRIELPHIYAFEHDPYASKLVALVKPHLHRLQSYDGADYIFDQLNPDGLPLRALVSLDIIGEAPLPWTGVFPATGAGRPQCLPNLGRLACSRINFHGQHYYSLQDLVCTLTDDGPHDLFVSCPNLLRAEFCGWQTSQLPHGPVPSGIREIVLQCGPLGDRGLDGISVAALRVWAGECIPKLVLVGVPSLDSVVDELLAAHGGPTGMTISARDQEQHITLSDAGDSCHWRWTVKMCEFWGSPPFLDDLQPFFTGLHIVTLTVCIERLDALLAAQVDAPQLLSLELSLAGYHGETLSPTPSHSLLVPRLQHFAIDVGGTNAVELGNASLFDALSENFRQLIVYDAELLETVTVKTSLHDTASLNCASFSRFARRYIEMPYSNQ